MSAAPSWQLVDQGRGGGEVRLIETDGEWAVVEATQAFPIGATLRAVDAATGVEYRIKVRGGKKVAEGWFRVEGRLMSLTREQREKLLGAIGKPSEA
ncbi:MAG: hypothetical protein ABI895_26300 [Deltaproteobacteria bacterium]